MPTYRGFVESIQVRDDGWVEFSVLAVHAGNGSHTFFIEDLDGSLEEAHRRLAQLSLLRDALGRVLPVEVEYRDDEVQGSLVEDLTVLPRASLEGRPAGRRIVGVVIGLAVAELGPTSGSSPYRDPPDLAGATLLADDGSVEQVLVDLQRPDPLTGHGMLRLLGQAHRTRRPVAVIVSQDRGRDPDVAAASRSKSSRGSGFVQACEWITVPEAALEEVVAFVERLGQRYESYERAEAPRLSRVRVLYTTAPDQTPEGDISDNGAFAPVTREAWVHGDSPLLARLETALRDRLQVRLGLAEDEVHAVELVGRLGSAARPVWITVDRRLEPEQADGLCANTPTIQAPTAAALDEIPVSVSWSGSAYFNEGIWRFALRSGAPATLRVDGKSCCDSRPDGSDERGGAATLCHAYLNGVHGVDVVVTGRVCAHPFQLQAYRIR